MMVSLVEGKGGAIGWGKLPNAELRRADPAAVSVSTSSTSASAYVVDSGRLTRSINKRSLSLVPVSLVEPSKA